MTALEGEEARAALALLPRAGADDSVFPAPWAARAFAFTVALHERGLFGWPEWAQALGREVHGASADGHDDAEDYWRRWLRALERLLAEKGLASPAELAEVRDAWERAAAATPHGEAIELAAGLSGP